MTFGLITVCYNSESTIANTLNSIRVQKRGPDEIIIIDGGSSDHTLKIIKEYNDLPLKIISEADTGIYNAMNKGLNISTTDVVGYLNSDDFFASDTAFKSIVDAFNSSHKIDVFVSGVNYVNEKFEVKRHWPIDYSDIDILNGGNLPHPGFYCRREILTNLGGFNESYRFAADFDLILRVILSTSHQMIHLDKGILVCMLEGGVSNRSIRNILIGNKEIRASLKETGVKFSYCYTLRRFWHKILQKV